MCGQHRPNARVEYGTKTGKTVEPLHRIFITEIESGAGVNSRLNDGLVQRALMPSPAPTHIVSEDKCIVKQIPR